MPTFSANPRGRDFVVGDLHGQMALLDALLSAVAFTPGQDRLFSVGDLIDRGAHSAELLRRFSAGRDFFAVRGNHEAMLIASDRSLAHFQSWQRYGGYWALPLALPARLALAALAERLPLTIALDLADGRRIGLVHAEVPPATRWDEACAAAMSAEDLWDTEARTVAAGLMWGRRRFLALEALREDGDLHAFSAPRRESIRIAARPVEGADLIICGHNIIETRRPEMLGNTLFIDTGAYEKAGRLTMVEPLTGHYWQSRRQGRAIKASARPKKIALDGCGRAPP